MSELQQEKDQNLAKLVMDAIINAYKSIGENVEIKEKYVHKTNETIEALTVSKLDYDYGKATVSPTIYPRDYEQDIASGVTLSEIGEKIRQQVDWAYENSPKLSVFTSEEASKHIRMVLINKDENLEIISNSPHYDIADTGITAIPRWFLDTKPGDETASFIVNNEVAKSLHMTSQEIIDLAYMNTQAEAFKVRSMEEVMAEIMGPGFAEIMPFGDTPEMIVISNDRGLYGAAGILNEGAMERVAEKLGTDEFFIIPSSLHECIAIRCEGNNPEEVKAMIMDVNATQVAKQDFLSNELMKYKGEKIELAIKPEIQCPIVISEKLEINHKMKL